MSNEQDQTHTASEASSRETELTKTHAVGTDPGAAAPDAAGDAPASAVPRVTSQPMINSSLLTPLAIVIGFALVAGALFLKDGTSPTQHRAGVNDDPGGNTMAAGEVRRTESPNLYGDPDAPVTIVEFSDYECPFCARLHPTLKRIVDESDGEINWEYRHLPLPSHRNAAAAALIGECVAKHAGNDAFWSYSDTVFSDGPGDAAWYESVAEDLGVSQGELTGCRSDAAIERIVQNDLDTVRSLGGNGTPYSVIVFADGTTKPVRGALPYQNWAAILEL